MRKIGALNLSDFIPDKKPAIGRRRRRRQMYVCSYCKYESTRQFNVTRHEYRIHSTIQEPRTCCGALFPTKGEFYLHCEHNHPEKRINAVVSRKKYKILANMIRIKRSSSHSNWWTVQRSKRRRRTFDDEDETEDDSEEDDTEDEDEEEKRRERNVEENRTYVLRRRYSERIRQKVMERRTKSELTFQCSITYSELDRENIPLAWFLKDRALRKACYSSTPATVNPPMEAATCNDATTMQKFDDPCVSITDTTMEKPSTEKTTVLKEQRSWDKEEKRECSHNDADTNSVLDSFESSRHWTSLSESSTNSFVSELPTKKLILRRFMTTMNFEVDKTLQQRVTTMPLQERDPYVTVASQSRRLIKNCKRSFASTSSSASSSSSYAVVDKENIPNLSLEEKVKVNLDRSITLPFVTKLHREFLSSIDFDNL